MTHIVNPVLPGFHPDPCLLRVGEDYYIANSSFEWWPGVPIYQSRDLVNWKLASYALTHPSQAELRGVPDSCGIWAPALSYSDGQFWLAYTVVRNFGLGLYNDCDNYVATAPSIEGPWSEPVYINSSGFDPSLFHDDDGRKWFLNMVWDHRSRNGNAFPGIVIQEYDPQSKRLVGDRPQLISRGTSLGRTEGPHILKRDGYYYLILAEGGTGWEHAVSIARSRELHGPYETHPDNPILTSAHDPQLPLQKSGHGMMCDTPDGEWYLSHLCSRTVGNTRRCPLGRETALQNIIWGEDSWPRLAHGSREPALEVSAPAETPKPSTRAFDQPFEDAFSSESLNPSWNTLREPPDSSWLSLDREYGGLQLVGRRSLASTYDQSLLGRRIQHHNYTIQTTVAFDPVTPQQLAGLSLFYNTSFHYYLNITWDEELGRVATLNGREGSEWICYSEGAAVPLPERDDVRLKIEVRGCDARFFCTSGEQPWQQVGPQLDASKLSDDYPPEQGQSLVFTGVFAALCAQDFASQRKTARFTRFRYEPVFR